MSKSYNNEPLTVNITPSQLERHRINIPLTLYEEELKWDPLTLQHSVKLIPTRGLSSEQPLWELDDFREWMSKLIKNCPEYLFFLEDNENGVDLALASLGTVIESKDQNEPLISRIRLDPEIKVFLLNSLEYFVKVHDLPLSSTHRLYMKILTIPNIKHKEG